MFHLPSQVGLGPDLEHSVQAWPGSGAVLGAESLPGGQRGHRGQRLSSESTLSSATSAYRGPLMGENPAPSPDQASWWLILWVCRNLEPGWSLELTATHAFCVLGFQTRPWLLLGGGGVDPKKRKCYKQRFFRSQKCFFFCHKQWNNAVRAEQEPL